MADKTESKTERERERERTAETKLIKGHCGINKQTNRKKTNTNNEPALRMSSVDLHCAHLACQVACHQGWQAAQQNHEQCHPESAVHRTDQIWAVKSVHVVNCADPSRAQRPTWWFCVGLARCSADSAMPIRHNSQ